MMSICVRLGAAMMVVLVTAQRGMSFVATSSSPRSISTTTTIRSNTIPSSSSSSSSSPFLLHKSEIHLRQTATRASWKSSSSSSSSSSSLYMAAQDGEKSSLPFWLDPGTRGGAVFLSLVLFLLPLITYSVVTSVFGVDEVEAGKWIGVGFTATASFLWVATYIFRVATKDMTYAKQLKDYENAVIAKRLEELDDDEIQALVEEIERDDF